jgi:hypothetical protein
MVRLIRMERCHPVRPVRWVDRVDDEAGFAMVSVEAAVAALEASGAGWDEESSA